MELTLENTVVTETIESNPWDKFYGLSSFYPGLYTPEQAWGIKHNMSDLWPLVQDVCYAGGKGEYYISSSDTGGQRVLLANKLGWPMLEVGANIGGGYWVKNWYRQFKRRGSERYSIHSKNRTYVINKVRPHLQGILSESYSAMTTQLGTAVGTFHNYLNDATNNANSISSQTLQPSVIFPALRTLFEPEFTQVQIDSVALNKLKMIYDDLQGRFANKKSYATRVTEMFEHPKWVIVMVPQYNDKKLYMVGSAKFTPKSLTGTPDYTLNYEMPLQLYRDLDSFYTTHPDDEGSLKAALMFCKVHREKDPASAKTYDTEGFIPCNNRGVYEDIGGISYCAGFILSTSAPHFLLLAK